MGNIKVLVVGGGAAGFFSAINILEKHKNVDVTIIEKSNKLLSKVKISGGGRCNVTHACFEPKELIKFYPRGNKELLGPFHQFMTGDTFDWFDKHGVELKIENDNRVFPNSNTSQTIVDCFLENANKLGVKVKLNEGLQNLVQEDNKWKVITSQDSYLVDKVVLSGGSSLFLWKLLSNLGLKIVNPVPSLFSFKIIDERLKDIPGVAVSDSLIKVKGSKLESTGALLVTHWGLSAPAILKLSAFGARELNDRNYNFKISVNWLSKFSQDEIFDELSEIKFDLAKAKILSSSQFGLPKRLWKNLCIGAKISEEKKWADVSKKELNRLIEQLSCSEFKVKGKNTFKDEFVTAGGVDLSEIDFKKFESKRFPNLYFAGEILNIDAVTGGFNFQNAWTGGWIISEAICD